MKLPYKIIDLGGEIFRVEDVIKVGVDPNEVVKTLVVKSVVKPTFAKASDGWRGLEFKTEYNALVLRGKDRLDFKKVRRILGQKTDFAKPDEVLKLVGVSVGAVCPIEIGIPLYFDKKVLELENVNLGSGDLTRGLDMKLEDLQKAVGNYVTADLV
jgi:prolyl-tRNA editing enzyme YbaK/EbsC (Cys-tRNA(Pro) deacylase)